LQIINAGFEADVIDILTSPSRFTRTVTAWTLTGRGGVFVPNTAAYATPQMSGVNALFVQPSGVAAQTLTGVTVSAGQEVIVTVGAGWRADFAQPGSAFVRATLSADSSVHTHTVTGLLQGRFVQQELRFTVPSAAAGSSITIMLGYTGTSGQINFDNVTVSIRNL
jgi:hypothetical protein